LPIYGFAGSYAERVDAGMKVLVTSACWDENKGDTAILTGIVQQIRAVLPDVELVLNSPYSSDYINRHRPHRFVEACFNRVTPSIVPADPSSPLLLKTLKRLLYLSRAALLLVLESVSANAAACLLCRSERQTYRDILSADLVVCKGGGWLLQYGRIKDLSYVPLVVHPAVLALAAHRKVVFIGHSVGPLNGRLGKWVYGWVLRRAKLIVTREPISTAVVRSLGVPEDLILEAADYAFTADMTQLPEGETPPVLNTSAQLLGLTIRNWGTAHTTERYLQAVGAAVERFCGMGYKVVLFPHVNCPDDLELMRHFQTLLSTTARSRVTAFYGDYSPGALQRMYGECSLFIGTRLHSVIFALLAGVPSVAIAYEHKTPGIMSALGMADQVVPIERITTDALLFAAKKALLKPPDVVLIGRQAEESHIAVGEALLKIASE
jgi:colanic acid/amylovoran biosynthesis protein